LGKFVCFLDRCKHLTAPSYGPVTAVEPTSMLICACITSIGAPSVAGPNVLGHIRLKSNLLHSDRHTTKRCLGGILLLANRTRLYA